MEASFTDFGVRVMPGKKAGALETANRGEVKALETAWGQLYSQQAFVPAEKLGALETANRGDVKALETAIWRFVVVCVGLLMMAVMVSCDGYHLEKRIKLFEEDMEAFRAQADNIGMSVVFIRDGEIAYVRHWGLRRIDSEEIQPDGMTRR